MTQLFRDTQQKNFFTHIPRSENIKTNKQSWQQNKTKLIFCIPHQVKKHAKNLDTKWKKEKRNYTRRIYFVWMLASFHTKWKDISQHSSLTLQNKWSSKLPPQQPGKSWFWSFTQKLPVTFPIIRCVQDLFSNFFLGESKEYFQK